MRQIKAFVGEHDDFVHDVAYDHYGKRLATCSSDHKIKVWGQNAAGEWQCEAELEGHRGAVWKLAWAHPEFGQVIVSCSFDQQLMVWEELDTPVSKRSPAEELGNDEAVAGGVSDAGVVSGGGPPGGVGPAIGGAGGIGGNGVGGNGVGGPGAGAGAGAQGGAVGGGGSNDLLSRWHRVATLKGDGRESVNDMKFAPRQFGLCLATCSSDGHVRIFEAADVLDLEHWTRVDKFIATKNKEEATCLSWNLSRFDSKMLIVGSMGRVGMWAWNQTKRGWDEVVSLETQRSSAINDVCWAPNLGRSFHLVAVAPSNSVQVEIWRLEWDEATGGYTRVEREALLDSSNEVWRCEWNITGTVLACSGDDGAIRLWRKNFRNSWNMITEQTLGK